ncbi:transcription initiation factor TFIID subunit 3 isoform X2 [Bufo bufo]|uniref:transcription initiation factor TFIID subunit 3 isoform X2 n=1 Tax=Bufo bufo TaxID=8384 RepID=UPI001ABE51F1|nr:transcription initiation factor TFIID subunit 3 isoform X2 [Bufo bufo]
MCESYSRSLLRVSVAQICQALGWDSVQVTACDLLTDVLHRYLQQLCRGAHRYSELYGRTDPVLDDVGQAFKLMGVNLHELEDYIHNIEPVTFPHQIPSFPVSKNNVLQFPLPGSKDVEDRKEYIPDYLPLIVSSQEEEEEEQVPTDGGTSAEAMQVPLEEGEMEDDETINDENYLSKRPLESPEVLDMPFAKRQRLANSKGDILDGTLEPREPLSSINAQKVSPMLSPAQIQDNSDLSISSSDPVLLSPVLRPQTPSSKPLESKAFTPKTKSKSSPGQKTKSPKSAPLATVLGSPLRSPKSAQKDKKSPGRAKSPKSPKSPKSSGPATQPTIKSETPSRTPLAALSEKIGRENIQVKQNQTSQDSEKLNAENPSKRPSVADNTIEDSIDAVIARACAEQEPDPFEFSSGSESEGDVFTSPRRLSIAEPATPKVLAPNSILGKACSTPIPAQGGTSSSDISWTMDDSINEVIRKVNQETQPNMSVVQPCFSSPSASPPTPEPLMKTFEEKSKLASPVELKKKAKKELKTKMKKKDKEKQKDKDKSKDKSKDKNKEKDKDGIKDSKLQWKDAIMDEDSEMPKIKSKDLNDSEQKPKQKENSGKKEKEKHKKKDKEKGKKDKEKKEKGKDKNKEEKLKSVQSTPAVLPLKDLSLPIISTPNAVRLPPLLPAVSPLVPEKANEDREKTKEKDKKKEKKEKKKKKDKEKVKEKEKEKKEKDKKDKDKEKHKHDKAKVELSIPAPSPVIPRLTLRVGAGQDTIVISKVVSAPDAKGAAPTSLPKSPPPVPSPAPAPVLVVPPPVQAPPAPATASPAPNPAPPATGPNTGNSKTPYRSVVTETVSTYVIRDEWGNQIWICPGCNKLDDGSPMVGCDGCDDWYHWPCVGLTAEPSAEKWFCTKCDGKKKDKKHKKRKHKAH